MSCPTWCEVAGEHILHRAVVARLTGVIVTVDAFEAAPATVCVTAPTPEVPVPLVDFAPADAAAAGRMLVAGRRDVELGQALLRAADLAESGEE